MSDSGGMPAAWDEPPSAKAKLVIVLLPAQARPAADPEFATCYYAEMPALIRFLVKCGAGHDDAADAAQEAFTQLFTRWDDVRCPRPWLRQVAFRAFLHQPVRNTVPLDDSPEVPESPRESDRFDFRDEAQVVLDLLDLLPTTQRAVLALHYDQFPTGDIAQILGLTQAAVRKNLERARATLKQLLDLSGGEPQHRCAPPGEGAAG
jgi:RNA polymerase sigma factor (sigma-70 family)